MTSTNYLVLNPPSCKRRGMKFELIPIMLEIMGLTCVDPPHLGDDVLQTNPSWNRQSEFQQVLFLVINDFSFQHQFNFSPRNCTVHNKDNRSHSLSLPVVSSKWCSFGAQIWFVRINDSHKTRWFSHKSRSNFSMEIEKWFHVMSQLSAESFYVKESFSLNDWLDVPTNVKAFGGAGVPLL